MNTAARILGPAALLLTVVPPLMVLLQRLGEPTMKNLMLAGCVLWFIAAPRFMRGGSQ